MLTNSSVEFEKLIDEWTEVLDTFCTEGDFDDYLGDLTYDNGSEWVMMNNEILGDYKLEYGATKLVIIPNEGKWVLKMPFIDTVFNFCEIEVENYHLAKKEGLDDAFAECHYLMEYKDAQCYIMEKINCSYHAMEEDLDSRRETDDFFEQLDKISQIEEEVNFSLFYTNTTNSYASSNDQNVKILLNYHYGDIFFQKLMKFIYQNNINDLHRGNIGYRDSQMVLIDFSGYC